MAKMNLSDLGWDEYSADHAGLLANESLVPARVLWRKAHIYFVRTDEAEMPAELAGKLTHDAGELKDLPVVGDWVGIKPQPNQDVATIHTLLPRKTAFMRKEAGARTQAQVVAANIDTIFLVCGLDGDFNPSRIERYLAAAWESGAAPVIVLNKIDVCADVSDATTTATALALGAPVLAVSATEDEGIGDLRAYIKPRETVAFLGSSGVGKSSLVNALLGLERQRVGEVRDNDNRGRHTTRHSELFLLPGGGILLDTPGMRELQLWSDGAGLARTFDDIEELATDCRFNDCAHDQEPGCAIKAALEDETLAMRRWDSYQKLKSELVHLASRQDKQAKLVEKKRKKELSMHIKQVHKRPRS